MREEILPETAITQAKASLSGMHSNSTASTSSTELRALALNPNLNQRIEMKIRSCLTPDGARRNCPKTRVERRRRVCHPPPPRTFPSPVKPPVVRSSSTSGGPLFRFVPPASSPPSPWNPASEGRLPMHYAASGHPMPCCRSARPSLRSRSAAGAASCVDPSHCRCHFAVIHVEPRLLVRSECTCDAPSCL